MFNICAFASRTKAIFLFALLILPLASQAQWGPGGVGNTNGTVRSSLQVQPAMRGWYRADNGPAVSGSNVTSWADKSGRNINVSQATSSLQPTLVNNAVNSKPVVRFTGVASACLSGPVVATGTVPSSAMTVFAVARNSATSSTVAGLVSYDGYQGMICSYTAGGGGATQYIVDGNGSNASNSANTITAINNTSFHLMAGIYGTTTNTNLSRIFMDGKLEEYQSGGGFPPLTAYSQVQVGGRTWGGFPARIFSGDIAELIVYDTQLDSAQRIIVENYLAEKYGVALTKSRFAYGATSRYDLAGIGQAFNGSKHDSAASSLLTVAAPQSLGSNRYMLFGHNNGAITLGTTETPGNDVNFVKRIDREWRFNKTGTDLGTTKLYVDYSTLNASLPSGFARGIFIDADGDFRTGATFVDLLPSSAGIYVTPATNIPNGSFVTIGCVKRVVGFELTSSQGFEDVMEYPIIRAKLNFPYAASSSLDVVVNYGVAPYGTYLPVGPCYDNDACDFDNGRSQVVIPAGQQLADINQDAFDVDAGLRIHNDTASEPNAEIVRVTISSVVNAGMGTSAQLTHDYSIIDDDYFRKISFISGQNSYAWTELDAGAYKDTSFVLTLPAGQTGGPSEVNVVATGVCKAGKDYRFLDANSPTDSIVRLEIGDLAQTVRVRIRLLGDNSNENTEVLSLMLTRPSSATLSGVNPITASITIADNDAPPTVFFKTSTASGDESVATVTVKVKLSLESGKLVTVPFSIGSGTATSGGTDFDLISPSPVYIYAGDTAATFTFEVIEDDAEEDDETAVFALGTPTNATVGSPSTFTYTILDNDVYGSTGPGGIDQNNGAGTLQLWFAADQNVTVSGSVVTAWGDVSGSSGRNATAVSGYGTPTYVTNSLNGKPIVRFNGQMLGGSFVTPQPGSPLTMFSVAKQTTAPPTVSGHTYGSIFCTDRWAGFTSYGTDYLLDGFTTSPGFIYPDATNTSNTSMAAGAINSFQILTGQYTQNGTQNSSLYRNTTLEENFTGTGPSLDIHTNYRLGVRYPNNSGYYFKGDVAEVIFFSSLLNAPRHLIIETYLAAKYGLTIPTNYYYASPGVYSNDVAGIGTSDGTSNNKHRTASSVGLTLRQVNNSLNVANEYVFFGHNPGTASVTVQPVGSRQSEVWTRMWRVKKTGSIDTRLIFDYDAAGIAHTPLAVTEYFVAYRAGTSGAWTNANFYARTLVGNKVSFDIASANLADGYYTLARTDPTTLPVVFSTFDVYRKGQAVQVRWATASEENSDHFDIERSGDGKAFDKIGQVAAAGNSDGKLSYAFLDQAPLPGTVYYRLRELDRDGKDQYSPVRQVTGNASVAGFSKITVYPNPATGLLSISLPAEEGTDEGLVSAEVLDTRGVRIASLPLASEGSTYRTDVSALRPGMYMLRLRLATGEVHVRSMVKQ